MSTKMVRTLAGIFFGLLVVSALLYFAIVNAAFTDIEDHQDQAELDRVSAVLRLQLEAMEYLAEDIGHWDLTYEYVLDRNDDYLEANFSAGELDFLGANFVAIANTNQDVVFSKSNLTQEIPTSMSQLWLKHRHAISGFVNSEHGPIVVAMLDIRQSDGNGKPRGFVAFGRVLDEDLLREMSNLSGHELLLTDNRNDRKATYARGTRDTNYYLPIDDISGERLGTLTFTKSREVRAQANATYIGFIAALAFALVVTLIAIRLVFNQQVTSALTELSEKIAGIENTSSLPAPTTSARQDEIGDLERSFNAMLEQLGEYEKINEETNAKLRHTEKLKALGQLTGGIAHDFNNLLLVIMGNINLIMNDPTSQKVDDWLKQALGASEKASSLVKYLLAYAQKQPLRKVDTDIVFHLSETKNLLDRALRDEIEVVLDIGIHSAVVETDPNQLETAILNIALNAQDAMPRGGTLTLSLQQEVRILESGEQEYVILSISDDGFGMSQDVSDHAFDPFFTTKAIGKGSGLGLSMVQGFVQQCGGDVAIQSEPARGTTIELILPLKSRHSTHAAA